MIIKLIVVIHSQLLFLEIFQDKEKRLRMRASREYAQAGESNMVRQDAIIAIL